jgi:hypothetical protein
MLATCQQRERNQSHYLIFPHSYVSQSTSQCYKINARKKKTLLLERNEQAKKQLKSIP